MNHAQLIRWFRESPNAYMVLDRELRYVAANDAYLKVTGSTEEELLGRYIFEQFPNDPDDALNEPRQLLEASLHKVLATGKRDVLAYIPYRVAREPGLEPELRIWSATHTPLLNDAGEVEGVMQFTEDVTALHDTTTAAQILNRAEQVQRDYVDLSDRLRALVTTLDQAPGFMAMLRGPEHTFELANQAYEALVGGRPLLGLPVRDAMPELRGQGYFEILDKVFETQEPFLGRGMRVELQPFGERRDAYVDFVYQPVLGPDGETYGVLVQGHEITDQVRGTRHNNFRTLASQHVATADGDIESALAKIAWSAVETIADWAFVDVFEERGTRRLLVAHADSSDTSAAEVLSRHSLPGDFVAGHPLHGLEQKPCVITHLSPSVLEALAGESEHLAQLTALTPISMLAVPLWDRHRERLHGVLMLLTARSRRLYLASDLEPMTQLGELLATALENTRLARERRELLHSTEQARQQAETASRAKDDFLALLGHELRNPLAPILTAVDILRLHEDTPVRELSIIERQARHLARLVDDMLDVSRIVHGKLELRQGPVALSHVVSRAVEMASPFIDQKDHELEVHVATHHAQVFGDEARLAQVLVNLLTNAARYTPEGGHIRLDAAVEGNEVVMRVRDDGVGIDAETLPQVFDLFVQAPQTAERTAGGLGLGLTLVKRLVELHEGSVGIASEGRGKGVEVTVRLPAHRESQAARPEDTPNESAASQSLRVLVVDDNEDAAELLAVLLRRAGHEVDVCHDGQAGLEHMLRDTPDAAVVDLGLPGLDGLEVARRVRQQLGDGGPRLLALTGYGGDDDKRRSREAGFDLHLTKPVDGRTLLAALRDERC